MLNAPIANSGCKWAADGVYVCATVAAGAPPHMQGLQVGREGFMSSGVMATLTANKAANAGADTDAVVRVKQLSTNRVARMDQPIGPIPRVARVNPDGSSTT